MHDAPPDLFDRRRRAHRRGRAVGPNGDFIGAMLGTMVIDRLDDVQRSFADTLVIGGRDPSLIAALRARGGRVSVLEPNPALAAAHGGHCCDEDRIDVPPESQDLIVWAGGLDSVNDVPGALLRCRLALRPDGLLIGCMVSDGSFPALRHAVSALNGDRAVARLHPQIEVRAMGDLLARAGLTLTVADVDKVDVAYRSFASLVADLRSAALTNVLAGHISPADKAGLRRAAMAFAALAGPDGRTIEQLRIVHFNGWAPHPDQPQPARRGSGTVSLAAQLKPPPSIGE